LKKLMSFVAGACSLGQDEIIRHAGRPLARIPPKRSGFLFPLSNPNGWPQKE
jgi:hypothetical protein